MFSILISEKGGETKRLDFDRPEITIGRVAGNDIVLPRGNISKRHSRIVFKDAKFVRIGDAPSEMRDNRRGAVEIMAPASRVRASSACAALSSVAAEKRRDA